MTARKRFGPVPTHRLAVRHSVGYSSSDHFFLDDSSSSSSLSSSSETSSDSSTDALSDFASSHSSSDYSLPVSPLALSYARADLLPSPKRIRRPESATDLEDSFESYIPREIGLGVDFEDESSKLSRSRGIDLEMDVDVVRSDGIEIDPETQVEIDECFAYADALRDRGIDARVIVKAIDREDIKTGMRGPVEEGAVKVAYETLGDLVQRFHDHTEEIPVHHIQELERDNRRLRDIVDVKKVNGNGGNGNEGNGNGNGNDGKYGYNFGGFMPARECTYQDFLKCQPLNFNRTEGVVGLTRWFEKMETVFHISNCPEKYQVKYASCTLLNSALTWWNSHKRTIGIEEAYAMSWAELMNLMTEVYCPINEVQKMETELWNLAVKGNGLTAYTR
ncbi:reverse transcriptase domain-containing protein [Tanacetum coccineum]|uniref:Reverse transcriptase domain-containing protein n=1 Tax=Tanacetum coccineum TaxID=301880 RepID=A0ABQ5GG26_9ASTR